MLDAETKKRIDTARNILVGKVPDPKSQVEQITIALIYKFMDDMDAEAEELGGKRTFFSGEFARYGWASLMDVSLGGQETLNRYAEGIEKMNQNQNVPQLFRDIFKNAFLPYRDPETLKMFLKTINEFQYEHSERLGDAFEYLLSVMSSQGDAGQFRTPRHIIDFMVELVDPKKEDRVLDPACGTAGFLISAYKHILREEDEKQSEGKGMNPEERKRLMENFEGYDISPDMVRLSLVNLYLHGFPTPKIYEYDTLTSEDKWNDFADVILANPPFMSPKGGIRPHKRFSVESNRSEVLFVDYIMEHLTTNGRAAVIVPEGIIFQNGKAYKALRKMLVESDFLVGVISLPAGVFNPYSGVKTSILWIDRALAKKSDSIIFCKVAHDGYDLGAQRRANGKSDLPEAIESLKEYKTNLSEVKRFRENGLINQSLVEKKKLKVGGEYNLGSDRYLESLKIITKFRMIPIKEIIDLNFGSRITKTNNIGTKYPVFGGGGESFRTDTYTREDDLVISRFAMSQECVRFVKGKFYLLDSGFTFTIKPAYENQVIKNFIDQIFLHSQEKIYSYARGHAQKNIDIEQFKGLEIPIPPLDMQREIVMEIEGYQKIIDGARMVVENYRPRIEVDPSWPVVKLGEVCETTSGGTPLRSNSKYYENGNVPWLKSGEVAQGYIFFSQEKITDEGLKNSSAKLLPIDTVLVAMYGATAGQIGLLKIVASTNQAICGILPNSIFVPEFLYFYLLGRSEELLNMGTGGAQPNISQTIIRDLSVPMPDIEEQKKIVLEIKGEEKIIQSNNQLMKIYQDKIKKRISKVWGEG